MNDEKYGIAPLKAEHGIHRMSWTEPTLQLAPAIQFAEGGPLQKLVLTFLSATAGLGAVFDAAKYPNFHQDALGVYRGTVREETRIDLPGVVIGVRAGALQANEAVTELCRMLAVAAWEVIKVWPGADIRNPVLQYLRHVRNAAAHNTAWHFLGEEPRHPAVWRDKVLEAGMHGRPCIGADILPGDLLLLLMDAEQTIPSLPPARSVVEVPAR